MIKEAFLGGWMGWMVIIGHGSSKSTFGANNFESTLIPTDCHYHGNVCVSKSGTKDVKDYKDKITL